MLEMENLVNQIQSSVESPMRVQVKEKTDFLSENTKWRNCSQQTRKRIKQ